MSVHMERENPCEITYTCILEVGHPGIWSRDKNIWGTVLRIYLRFLWKIRFFNSVSRTYSRERSGYTYPMVRRTNMADANERDFRLVFLLSFISIYSEQNLKIMLLIIWCHIVRICVAAYYIFVHDETTEIYDIKILAWLYVPCFPQQVVIRTIGDIVLSVARLIGRFQAYFLF